MGVMAEAEPPDSARENSLEERARVQRMGPSAPLEPHEERYSEIQRNHHGQRNVDSGIGTMSSASESDVETQCAEGPALQQIPDLEELASDEFDLDEDHTTEVIDPRIPVAVAQEREDYQDLHTHRGVATVDPFRDLQLPVPERYFNHAQSPSAYQPAQLLSTRDILKDIDVMLENFPAPDHDSIQVQRSIFMVRGDDNFDPSFYPYKLCTVQNCGGHVALSTERWVLNRR